VASHDKKGMIDRKEDETTEKSTLVADVSTPSQKNCQLPNLPVYPCLYPNTVCQSAKMDDESWIVSHAI